MDITGIRVRKGIGMKSYKKEREKWPVTCSYVKHRHFLTYIFLVGCLIWNMKTFCCHAANAEDLELYAQAAVLMDGESGRVLYGKKESEPMANASTTKIMTCIVILENCDMDEMVTVSSYAASMPKVNCGIRKGESYTVRDLLYSMMLESHNDSAAALAEHAGKRFVGSLADKEEKDFTLEESKMALKAFSRIMNEKAGGIGCTDTFFITPNGLDATETTTLDDGETIEKEHHTTARDLALIMAYCILHSEKKELFLRITQTPSHSFKANDRSFYCQNHNAFLTMMDGVVSGKTGFTGKAGYCYVGAVKKDGRMFIAALLACGWPNNRSYKWKDMRKLMEYGMERYRRVNLGSPEILFPEENLPKVLVAHGQGEQIGDMAWIGGKISGRSESRADQGILLAENEKVDVHVAVLEQVEAPVHIGQKLGEIRYMVGDVTYQKEDVVSDKEVYEIDYIWCLRKVFRRYCLGAI